MNTAFENGFIKAAIANGFTNEEARVILKLAFVPPGNLQGALRAGPVQMAPKPMQALTTGGMPQVPRPGAQGLAPKPMGMGMPKGPLAAAPKKSPLSAI